MRRARDRGVAVIGSKLGVYEVTAPLGVGGMGEVYRATDTRLKREVAIKVLPEAFTEDAERLARFEREAQLLAQLHHPNIASIFGLEESSGIRALVMELVEGPTLDERIASGPLPPRECIAIARQIAEALEAAHEKGIVHRDLKPQNVKISGDAQVKVLDFGLAKALEAGAAKPDSASKLARAPTLTEGATAAGVILGTAAYMAPEQARGNPVDQRADIWAFGVMLYEMLSGGKLFAGDTVSDTLAAVLRDEVDLGRLPAGTPAPIRRLLRRCLERNPRNRLHAIADARIVLDDVIAGRAEEFAAAAPRAERATSRRPLAVGLAAGVVAGAALGAVLGPALFAPPKSSPPTVRSLTYSGTSGQPSMSADGRHLAFASIRDGRERIWLKQLASGEEIALTEGPDENPRISPDASSLIFAHGDAARLDIMRMPLLGGSSRKIARGYGAVWSPDGSKIAFFRDLGDRSQVLEIAADGGEERLIAEHPETLRGLAWSPDGSQLAVHMTGRVNSIGLKAIVLVDVASGRQRELLRLPSGSVLTDPIWDGDDTVLIAWSPTQAARRETLLRRIPLDGGESQTLYAFTTQPGRIVLAGPGALAFDAREARQNLYEVVEGDPLRRALTGGPTTDRQPAFSPDGKRIVFTSDRSGSLDLWSMEIDSGAVRRLTFDAADDWDPQWTPDGRHLVWTSNRSGNFEIWIADADGSGARQVTSDGVDAENPTMSADGEWIVYSSGNPAHQGIWKIRPNGTEATRLVDGDFLLPELSEKTGLVAAAALPDRSKGTTTVIVARLEDGEIVTRTVMPGTAGNTGRTRWMPDGRTLVLWGADGPNGRALYAQPIEPGVDTTARRRKLVTSEATRAIESFGISPVDGRIVVSVASAESDISIAEGVPGL